MVQNGHSDYPLSRVAQIGCFQLGGQLSLPLIPAVLEPYFNLRLSQMERGGEPRSLRAAQVALHVEGRLQLENLTPGENRASFLLPARLPFRTFCPFFPVLVITVVLLLFLGVTRFLQHDLFQTFGIFLPFAVCLDFERRGVRGVSVR